MSQRAWARTIFLVLSGTFDLCVSSLKCRAFEDRVVAPPGTRTRRHRLKSLSCDPKHDHGGDMYPESIASILPNSYRPKSPTDLFQRPKYSQRHYPLSSFFCPSVTYRSCFGTNYHPIPSCPFGAPSNPLRVQPEQVSRWFHDPSGRDAFKPFVGRRDDMCVGVGASKPKG